MSCDFWLEDAEIIFSVLHTVWRRGLRLRSDGFEDDFISCRISVFVGECPALKQMNNGINGNGLNLEMDEVIMAEERQ